MTLTEHLKHINTKPNPGSVFNDCLPEDETDFVSIKDSFRQFKENRIHVRHDDFSGLLSSSMLTDIPYEELL